jgi:hypothetical protein
MKTAQQAGKRTRYAAEAGEIRKYIRFFGEKPLKKLDLGLTNAFC